MRNVKDNRRINLMYLRDNDCGGKLEDLALLVDMDASNIPRYWSPDPNTRAGISNSTARKIERNAGRDLGWLDKDHSDLRAGTHGELHAIWDALSEKEQKRVLNFMDFVIFERGKGE